MTTVKKCSNRRIFSMPEDCALRNGKSRLAVNASGKVTDISKLIRYIDENVVGRNTTFLGPFGRRKVVYCDYTTSGRALHFIEEYILKEVLPLCGSSFTSTNVTALQSSLYRQEAHDIIWNAVHATDEDVVLFVGNGCTGALRNLIQSLYLDVPPIVFVGSSEHDSILLPWLEKYAKVIRIAESKEGFLDLVDLENKLQKERQLLNSIGSRAQFIGCFSAASNITGILADDIATTVLLHQYDAFSFWDYGCAAPYVPLDMNPLLPGNHKGVHKDAIFFSGHKFIGGVQSCGVVIAKRHLFKVDEYEKNSDENVYLATKPHLAHLQEIVKQESGCGAIVSSIRMGLAMHLKQTIGAPNIISREQKITKTVISFIRTIPEIILLGYESQTVKRLPIFSFLFRHPRGAFLHHNFVCTILNDVFGIQIRGGHVCAVPYTYDLLGIDEKLASSYEEILCENRKPKGINVYNSEIHSTFEVLRPGFTRISLPYFTSDSEITYILEAVKMVATEGWKLLPQYLLNPETAEWKHRTNIVFRERKWITTVRFLDGKMTSNERKISGQSPFPQDPADCLQMARNIFNKARKMAHRYPLSDQRVLFDMKADKLRWFMLPSEAQDLLLGNCQKVKTSVPFTPGEYSGTRNNSVGCESPTESVSVFSKSFPPLLDVSSMYCRHNSLTSFETAQLKRSSSFLGDKACSDCGCLSPFHSAVRREASPISRTRCYSLESSCASPSSRFLSSTENGQCSCGSQTDISDAESARADGHTSADFSDFGDMGITNLFPTSESENIQAYVKGVTEELATEIKTEIREVIATVDTVLSESLENLDVNSSTYEKKFNTDFRRTSSTPMLSNAAINQYSSANHVDKSMYYTQQPPAITYKLTTTPVIAGCRSHLNSYNSNQNLSGSTESQRSDVSDQVAVYLAELTSEMVTEMKSEFREMVHAVDEIISPSTGGDRSSSATTDGGVIKSEKTVSVTPKESCDDGSDDNRSPNVDLVAEMSLKVSRPIETEKRKSLTKSDSSSDSGVAEVISLSETTSKVVRRKISVVAREAKSSPNLKEELLEAQLDVEFKVNPILNSLDKRKRSFENVNLQPKWHCSPKAVWKTTVEAIKEYDMIKEGDRILVCLSGGKDSLSLLHTLHQYQYYSQSYGITFTFGAITIDSGNSLNDPRPLIPYLHALGVQYLFVEQKSYEDEEEKNFSPTCDYRSRVKYNLLFKTAKENNYNVLAMGHHFDDVAENFLMSVFHQGKLHSMKAHYYIREYDIRVIRPYIYVREKHLRQFTENRKLPVINENYSSYLETPKEKQRTRQLLAQQEILHPKLFGNLKSALQPLIGGCNRDVSCQKKKVYDEDASSIFVISDPEEEDPK